LRLLAAALAPSSLLDTESGYRNFARFRRQDEIVADDPVLLTTFYDVATLDVDCLVRDVLDRQFVDFLGLADDHFLLLDGVFEREIAFPSRGAVDQEYGQVFVRVGPGDQVLGERAGRQEHSAGERHREICDFHSVFLSSALEHGTRYGGKWFPGMVMGWVNPAGKIGG